MKNIPFGFWRDVLQWKVLLLSNLMDFQAMFEEYSLQKLDVVRVVGSEQKFLHLGGFLLL